MNTSISAFTFVMTVLIGAVVGIFVIGGQTLIWLGTGEWIPVPLSKVLDGIESSYIYHPTCWQGLATVIQKIVELHICFGVFASGIIITCLAFILDIIIDKIISSFTSK